MYELMGFTGLGLPGNPRVTASAEAGDIIPLTPSP